MTKEEMASKLNGREYGNEITPPEENEAKESGLVVVFGASDDLCEFRGAIYDEADCYEGGKIPITRAGVLHSECGDSRCPYFKKLQESCAKIKAIWDRDGYSWIYEAPFSVATFEIMEDGETYCRGIVFEQKELG
jgi:hypothetical protein